MSILFHIEHVLHQFNLKNTVITYIASGMKSTEQK